jgi:hypothetical protein
MSDPARINQPIELPALSDAADHLKRAASALTAAATLAPQRAVRLGIVHALVQDLITDLERERVRLQ